jgi:hypothetical protein
VTPGAGLRRLLALLIVLGLATSTWVLWTRSRVPQGGPESELVVRLETVYESSRLHGLSVDDLLDALRVAGVTTVAVEAKSLMRLEYSGQIVAVFDPADGLYSLRVSGGPGPEGEAADAAAGAWLADELASWAPRGLTRAGSLGPGSLAAAVPAFYPLPRKDKVTLPEEVFLRPEDPLAVAAPERDLILGLSPADIALVRRHGFLLAAFIPNRPGITTDQALALLGGLGDGAGFSAVKFDSPTALGWPDTGALKAVGRRLHELGLAFVIDDKPQPGLVTVAEAAGWHGLRQQPVWTRSEPTRFPEVARERRQNFLYIQSAFFDGTSADWLARVTAGIEAITKAMRERDLKMGRAVPLTAYSPPRAALGLMVAGVFAATALGFLLVTQGGGGERAREGTPNRREPRGWRYLLSVGLGAVVLLPALATVAADSRGLTREIQLLAGLGAALTFPLLAVGLALRLGLARTGPPASGGKARREGGLARTGRTVFLTVLVAGVATAGGLFIPAIGSDTSFMLRLAVFSGTKISLLAPPLLAAFLFLGMAGLYPEATSGAAERTGRGGSSGGEESVLVRGLAQLRRILNEDITFAHVFLLGLAGVAVLFLIMRSGNFPTLGITGLEMKVRSFLQQALTVRPRTKEFLIGYPALILLLWWGPRWLDRLWRRWAALILTVAATVGLSSIVNTFAHQHIPVSVSLLRTINGLVLGLPIGLAAVACAEVLLRMGRRFAATGSAAVREGKPRRGKTRQ